MNITDNEIFPYYTFRHLSAQKGLCHFVSSGKYNIGFTEQDAPANVAKHRCALAQAVGVDPGRLILGQQVHSAHVRFVTAAEAGRGALEKEGRLPDTDALITTETDVCLMVLAADCVPILLYDPEHRVVAAVHAGWRGTAQGIVKKTVRLMQEKANCRPPLLLAGIGPSVGPCCFEVGPEVAEVFNQLFPAEKKVVRPGKYEGKYQVDLWGANRRQLLECGLCDEHIEVAGMCSVCHPDHFFSYRREGKRAGRFGAGICLLPLK